MTDDVTIVRVTDAGDLDGILAVDQESFSHPWSRQMYEDDLRNGHAQIWTARTTGGDTIGYCAIWMVIDELHINNVAVRRAWRGQGIGEALVKHVLAIAAGSGVAMAMLEVRRANQPARALYTRLGFRENGVRHGYYEDPPDDALLLRLPIQSIGACSNA